MARRNATVTEPEAPVADENTETVTPDESTSTETPAVPADDSTSTDAPAPAADKPAPVPLNIDTFVQVLNAGLDSRDLTTGVLSVESDAAILKAYRELPDAKNKKAARAYLQDGMQKGVEEQDIILARAFMLLSTKVDSLKGTSTGTPAAPKAPVDPTEAFVETAVRLKLAMHILLESKPEKVADDWNEKVNAKIDELKPQLDPYATFLDSEDKEATAPEGTDELVVQAFKTYQGKSAGAKLRKARAAVSSAAGDGVRRDIAKHVQEAFAEQPNGTFLTIAQIAGFKSVEYGDNKPSSGALQARLFPQNKVTKEIGKTTIPGVVGEVFEDNRGARKVPVTTNQAAAA